MLKSAFGGLSTGVCRQPQWAYVGVFMYSLAGWSCEDEIGLGTWVELCHRRREKYNSRGYRFLMFTGISAGILSLYPRGDSFPRLRGYFRGFSSPVPARRLFSAFPRVYSRVFFPCTRAAALFRVSAGLFAGFLSLYPRGGSFPRFRGFIRAFSFPVPARRLFSVLTRVYPREIFSCTRAAALFRAYAGIFAGFLSLYPRGVHVFIG